MKYVLIPLFGGAGVTLVIVVALRADSFTLAVIAAAALGTVIAAPVGIVFGILAARAWAPGRNTALSDTDAAGLPAINVLPVPESFLGGAAVGPRPPTMYERTLAPRPSMYGEAPLASGSNGSVSAENGGGGSPYRRL